jgi:hypothetical protein
MISSPLARGHDRHHDLDQRDPCESQASGDRLLSADRESGTISGVAAVYQRHEFLEERKTALEAWGRYVQSLTDGTERDNVVKLHDG